MKPAITKSVDLENGQITWSINPELLRIYSYLFFWLIVFCGWYFTKHHSDVDFQYYLDIHDRHHSYLHILEVKG